MKTALCLLVVAALVTQFHQARQATGRFASDDRNPFAYVPTRNDIEKLEPWLKQLQQVAPGGTLEPIGVDRRRLLAAAMVSPLVRENRLLAGATRRPNTDCRWSSPCPKSKPPSLNQLQQTHTPLPRGLRAGVPVVLFVRNDIWNSWKKKGK